MGAYVNMPGIVPQGCVIYEVKVLNKLTIEFFLAFSPPIGYTFRHGRRGVHFWP